MRPEMMSQGKEIYRAEIVGGLHGLTCIFPRLRDIVDYEEQKRVPQQGYPRFIPHPFVVAVQEKYQCADGEVIALQTPEAASFIHSNYFDAATWENSQVKACEKSSNRFGPISVSPEFAKSARDSVASAGVIMNSRKAQRILEKRVPPEVNDQLRYELSQLEKGSSPELTFLYTSGMAAIYSAIDGFLKKETAAMVIGNTYVDTYKLFRNLSERFSFSQTVFTSGDEKVVIPDDVSVVFLEIPTNPLLKVADLRTVVGQAHSKGVVVIVDSTIASPFHFSPFDFDVDIVIHSTSKSLSGKNNHIGGVLFVNPGKPHLVSKIMRWPFELDPEERAVLSGNLRDFPERIRRMADNTFEVVEFLKHNPNVSKVYTPDELKDSFGHVVSFELNEDRFELAEAFYDNCTIPIKGPSMGYEKTMLMPYSLITHYHDNNVTLAELGLKRYLMRLSVGTENPDSIITNLVSGFSAVVESSGFN